MHYVTQFLNWIEIEKQTQLWWKKLFVVHKLRLKIMLETTVAWLRIMDTPICVLLCYTTRISVNLLIDHLIFVWDSVIAAGIYEDTTK